MVSCCCSVLSWAVHLDMSGMCICNKQLSWVRSQPVSSCDMESCIYMRLTEDEECVCRSYCLCL
jgi:hypothetical protein